MKHVSKNPSGRYLQMTDEQVARMEAAFQRAVERQRAKDAAAAERGRKVWAAHLAAEKRRNAR